MSKSVSIVMPALATPELLEESLPPLLAELERRGLDDEVWIVDDSGEDALRPLFAARFPLLRFLARSENGGFARALASGVERARHELVFSMNSDLVVRAGFLEPLIECIADPRVRAVVPRVLLNGREDKDESLTALSFTDGFLTIEQPGLKSSGHRTPRAPTPVAFAVGGACLFRREDFLADGGFDPLFEPFYLEDVDWCFSGWRRGLSSLYQPAAVVEHHHRGTIGKVTSPAVVRAAIERNRYLFLWKHLDDPGRLREHIGALYRGAVDAWIGDVREELVWLNLALEEMDRALAARALNKDQEWSFARACEESRPRMESEGQ